MNLILLVIPGHLLLSHSPLPSHLRVYFHMAGMAQALKVLRPEGEGAHLPLVLAVLYRDEMMHQHCRHHQSTFKTSFTPGHFLQLHRPGITPSSTAYEVVVSFLVPASHRFLFRAKLGYLVTFGNSESSRPGAPNTNQCRTPSGMITEDGCLLFLITANFFVMFIYNNKKLIKNIWKVY